MTPNQIIGGHLVNALLRMEQLEQELKDVKTENGELKTELKALKEIVSALEPEPAL